MTCTNCGKKTDEHAAMRFEDIKPRPGDISFCLYCGTMYTFDKNLELQPITPEQEKQIFESDPELGWLAYKIRNGIKQKIKSN